MERVLLPPDYGEVEWAVVPSERVWNIFKKELGNIGAWTWRKRYDHPVILDGTQ